jgi:hypothetical protein
MILNHHDALTFVVRKNLHDGVDRAIGPWRTDNTISFMSVFAFEERERSDGSIH